jgi:general secretion pathway protein L
MAIIEDVKILFGDWITAVAAGIDAAVGRVVRPRQLQLVEGDDNTFMATATSGPKGATLPDAVFRLESGRPEPALSADWEAALRGSRLHVLLKPDQVLFRSLDFPKRAVDFLDGMIRSQIDRLTPWAANDAMFGWSPPADLANERIQLQLAATSKARMQPLVQFATSLRIASISAFAEAPSDEGGSGKIKMFETSLQRTAGQALDVPRLLRLVLLGGGLATVASMMVAAYFGSGLDAEQQQLQRRITERRAALRLNRADGGSALDLLAKRKQTTPSSVIVLEAMSRVLPDSTYVTEFRIEGDKVQVVGLTQDAPSLVKLMEQSPQFSQATFFAPTTRSQNDPAERFHIEARLKPYFGSGT